MGHFGGRTTTRVVPFILLCLPTIHASEFNHLNWVEISQNKLSTQIMLDFQGPVHCEHEIIKEKHILKFIFPGMNLQSFNHEHVLSRLLTLKDKGFIKNIDITEKTGTVEQVVLSLEFAPSREVVDSEHNAAETRKNKFLVKWNTLDTPARLIIDIFMQEDLENLIKKSATLLHATNEYQQYDTPIQSSPNPEQQRPRIVLDPGHGGSDFGAKGVMGLAEKDITLDITKRLNVLLKKNGYQSLLIRSNDKTVSLVERAHIAHQLKADLLVSVHVNSTMNYSENAWGIETFFLEGKDLLPRKGKTGFLFINCEKDVAILKALAHRTKALINKSKTVAQAIQTNIIKTLTDKNIKTNNRGVKKEKFRVFLQTEVPSALVEVGFLTNPKEAARLAKSGYRKLLARGIYDGICEYLQNN